MLIGCERLGEGEWGVAAKMEEAIYNSTRREQPSVTCTWVWKARWLAEIDTARMAVWLWTGSCKSGHTPSTADPTLPTPHFSPGALCPVRQKGGEQGFSHQEPQSKGTPPQRCRGLRLSWRGERKKAGRAARGREPSEMPGRGTRASSRRGAVNGRWPRGQSGGGTLSP